MYFFTGNNIFGQWLGCIESIIEGFRTFPEEIAQHKTNITFDAKRAKLLQIGWSHNIFLYNNEFYLVGDYKHLGHCIEAVSQPIVCCYNSSNVTVISNDGHLFIVNKDTCTIHSMSMETKELKTIQLTTEIPVQCEPKRHNQEVKILKCIAANDTLMFITNDGSVYSGLLPSLVETCHCNGNIIDMKCGYEHFLILTDSGRVYTWGSGRRLQLGHGDISSIDIPTEVEALAGIRIVKIAAGGWHSLALSEFGDIYAWGWNDCGQLGVKENPNESLQSHPVPILVDLFDEKGKEVNINIEDIACGSRHSAVLLEDHTIWTTGNNKYGQLGLSIKSYPIVHHYKKAWSVSFPVRLLCGQWSTVLEKIVT